ncbi:sigma-54-dependent Fis family transcriptional regulator [Desulfuromonas acetoxidans]|uniref:Two component, sigma54 specific, transcriptional regulator, Fis family n=1 Tax=Desulfuromonas acetoxidans (strain DSM 684 / 11070) TaxID=281689 RepID=Q1K2E9_DESA6|nr:sigma-54 dependent transcriptional regulator [Desulfuromonas acetoxidans]EAT16490.1 two component, sigma54 specific, transcriptional regulator, Fis family [Desulfuromonas acetoxidans DSM 684]MBF0647075.1 sigma-54-dependent Fis family transcriptional regulator [Desulfuromonas acetoxidans]NVD26214.1 sigma-54-dependent Fis family transcriptional regulator [Desulfuromonas acetoxidans]NVE14856.1 sigma-54-dependent Fis family transcriptional regulator [Desulfuromonas acetoxidans]
MSGGQRVLLIDNEEGLCRMMEAVLKDSGYQVKSYTRSFEAVEDFEAETYDLVISDIKMPGMDGLEVLQKIRSKDQRVPVIMITAYATVETSIQALRKGAYDMLTKPFEPEELLYRVKNALNHTLLAEENQELKKELSDKFSFDNIIGASSGLKSVLETVKKVAVRDTSVLITGESGTGKELIAQAIHHNSPRRNQRFMAINCGALPESVLESELFGYKKGAFTGAGSDRKGILETADGGTLFLDEIGNLPMNVQKTLLRFLQEQEFMRIGDTKPIKVDVRVISATNADLQEEMDEGRYREDLFYRLNVVNIHLPPLRERTADLPLLAAHFIRQQNKKFGTSVQGLTPEAMQLLCAYDWPGNIRQMENVVEACMTLESADLISLSVLSQFITVDATNQTTPAPTSSEDYAQALGEFETNYLINLLNSTGGNVEEAARQAGMNMATIYRKLKKYQIRKEDYLPR